MKTAANFIVVLFLIFCIAQSTTASDKDAATIVGLENKWAQAAKTGDAAAVRPMLAETFVTTDVSGHSYSKQELLQTLKGGKWEYNATAMSRCACMAIRRSPPGDGRAKELMATGHTSNGASAGPIPG